MGPRLRRLRRAARRRGARAQAVVDRRAVPRRRPGDRQDPRCRASHPRRHRTRRDRASKRKRSTRRATGSTATASTPTRSPSPRTRPRCWTDSALDPPVVLAIDDGPHIIEASSPPGCSASCSTDGAATAATTRRRAISRTSPTSSRGWVDRAVTSRSSRAGPGGSPSASPSAQRCCPAIVMVVRAVTERWVPLFDAAYFTVRSRDVGTSHNPLVGAWSMGSREVGTWLNNLGPLQLDAARPVHQARPVLGHGGRRGGDEHRRDRRRVAGQPPHPRIRRRCRGDGRHRRARNSTREA